VTTSTEDLIDGFADRLVPLPPRMLERRLAMAVVAGATVVFALVVGLVGLRSDLSIATGQTDFWVKLIYAASIALIAFAGARRLARPEVSGIKLIHFAAPIGILLLLASYEYSTAPADQQAALILGASWRECPILILSLSLPLLAILLRLFSGFAPSRPRLTGAVIGLGAGATTAMLYSLHCPESAMTFLLIWYTAGIALVAALGALIGPRILRW
jgi:hypothetical protein